MVKMKKQYVCLTVNKKQTFSMPAYTHTKWWLHWKDYDLSCYLVNFCVLLILFCLPVHTFFIEDKQVIDCWLYFWRRNKDEKSEGTPISPHRHLFYVHLICSYSPMQLSVAFCHSPELPHTETLPPLLLWYPSTQRWITTLLLCHTTSELARKGTGPHLAGKQWHWLVN